MKINSIVHHYHNILFRKMLYYRFNRYFKEKQLRTLEVKVCTGKLWFYYKSVISFLSLFILKESMCARVAGEQQEGGRERTLSRLHTHRSFISQTMNEIITRFETQIRLLNGLSHSGSLKTVKFLVKFWTVWKDIGKQNSFIWIRWTNLVI